MTAIFVLGVGPSALAQDVSPVTIFGEAGKAWTGDQSPTYGGSVLVRLTPRTLFEGRVHTAHFSAEGVFYDGRSDEARETFVAAGVLTGGPSSSPVRFVGGVGVGLLIYRGIWGFSGEPQHRNMPAFYGAIGMLADLTPHVQIRGIGNLWVLGMSTEKPFENAVSTAFVASLTAGIGYRF